MRRKANRAHILEKKSSKRKRRLKGETVVSKGEEDHVKRQLGLR